MSPPFFPTAPPWQATLTLDFARSLDFTHFDIFILMKGKQKLKMKNGREAGSSKLAPIRDWQVKPVTGALCDVTNGGQGRPALTEKWSKRK